MVKRMIWEAQTDWEGFWARGAEQLPWFRKWDKVFEYDRYPSFRWFIGAQTNIAYNALDHHVQQGRGGVAALIYENEAGERQVFTYAQLLEEVKRVAAALRGLGVQKGDRVAIYMPTMPEAIIAMLATARIGAIHLVVFAGFGSGALIDRVQAAGARFLLTADVTFRKGRNIYLKPIVDEALRTPGHQVERVVVLRRTDEPVEMVPERDMEWETFLEGGRGQSGDFVVMEANEPVYILPTSGTTAKPKLAVHVHGGYQVGIYLMARWVYGLQPNDIWWATSDIGWVVGHSYIVYAPLLTGCTTVAYEGALDHPGPEVFWRLIAYNHISGIFTSPTALRLLMRYGEKVAQSFDLSPLQRLFCAGEVLNPPVWEWLQKQVFQDRIPVLDHMWQTETGGPLFGNPYGIGMLPIKPGSAGIALPGIEAAVVTPEGEICPPGEKGIVVIKKPFPSLIPTLWGEPERYGRDYWEKIPNYYVTGDAGYVDEDGYYWFAGRADEVIKIAAHRIGTTEVETAFLKHPAVAEAGVTGRPDPTRGEVISAFIALREGYTPSEELRQELIKTVRNELGPVAVIGEINFVQTLPKTRSGKIMRRVFKAVVLDKDPGDISAIEDEGSVEEAQRAWQQLKASLQKTE
ncbi:MAG: acetate--CoA ligase [Nitrospinota bacterium]|nr:MAG: acetate--CoA ligase [Nitrospinota bacterium]